MVSSQVTTRPSAPVIAWESDLNGTIEYYGTRVPFQDVLERKQWQEEILFDVWRDEQDAKVTVPLFINQGDKIRVDTRIGEYMERA